MMPDRQQVNASARSLFSMSNSSEFNQGVEMLRHACAASVACFRVEVERFASGLLVSATNGDTQRGIMALAVMLGANPDALIATAYAVRMCEQGRPAPHVVVIDAPGREVTR